MALANLQKIIVQLLLDPDQFWPVASAAGRNKLQLSVKTNGARRQLVAMGEKADKR